MTRSRTAKVHKTSYAERVLGAMTQIQKEHRKHAVHMATLRAQVRKNAAAKRDTLGPHWSQWVGKAVHKLTEDGVIQHTGSQEVTFTPEGKNLISSAKKGVSGEDDLWHRVSTSISRGTKRRRSSTGPNREAPSISANKRLRSVSTIRTSTSQSPVRPSRKSIPTVAFRDISPLTDISESEGEQEHYEEENARLKSQLRSKNIEIEELRNRVATLTQQQATTPSISRHATPEPSFDSSHALAPIRPEVAILKVGKGITRTQSGSIIPNISKQPTPAPSDSGDDEIEAELARGDTAPLEMDTESATATPGTMLTPSSPSRPQPGQPMFDMERREPNSRLQPGHDALRGGAGEAIGELEQHRPTGRVEELERLLGEKETVISDLQLVKEGLTERNSGLQEEIAKIRSYLAEETEKIERANSNVRIKEHDISTLKQSLTSLQAEREDIANRLLREQANLHNFKSTNEGLVASLMDVRSNLSSVQAELFESRQLASAKDEALVQTAEKLAIVERSKLDSEKALQDGNAELRKAQEGLRSSESLMASLNEDSKTKDAKILDLSGKLADAEQRVSITEELLAAAEARSEEAQQELNRKIMALQNSADLGRAEINGLSSKVAEVEIQLEEAKASLVGARAAGLQMKMELESEKRRTSGLGEEKAKADEIIGTLERRIAELTAEAKQHAEVIGVLKTCIDDYRQLQAKSLDDLMKKVDSIQPDNRPIGVC
ncbi:hypothetical protein EST38_g5301 [Candolleomyces aberdarensis]|uniref:Uncharacterized protein n=1 Tax=Candolleomyces aberdarensis TaxID=2316362 RepID=A0A4Q2DP03_9AGAR|nr:hypothetical protein EST38_g5301 [Candolleomyces aberdarensis]